MKQLHKRLVLLLVVCGALLVFFAPFLTKTSQVTAVALNLAPMGDHEILVSALGAGAFNENGMYLCRPDNPKSENVYTATIDMWDIAEFDPQAVAVALVCRDGEWVELDSSNHNSFWVDVDDVSNCSVRWYLRETAPAAVYGVRCYYENNGDIEKTEPFRVLYTDEWTYIKVTDDKGNNRIEDFNGGDVLTLWMNVTFNDGAAKPTLSDSASEVEGIPHDAIEDMRDIVSLDNMEITIKTLSGTTYSSENFKSEIDPNDKNCVSIRFMKELEDDIYIVQFTSVANNRIVGQFVIDNTSAKGGVNLSQIWALLMIVGGVLAFGAAAAFLVPFAIVKVNETRVDKERERVDRMKNPEKYAESDKKSLKSIFGKIIYNIKTPAYKRKKDQDQEEVEKPVEEKVYTNRFTEMLRERQEKRDFMRENNVTSEQMEKMKEAEEKAKREEASSFAALRDDDEEDDEIATFHAAEDEISTLETGAYKKDGTTFAKLDSMRDDESQDGNNNDGK